MMAVSGKTTVWAVLPKALSRSVGNKDWVGKMIQRAD